MGKSLKCGDLVPGCEFEAKGTEEEILQAAGKHAVQDHGMEVTDELVQQVKAHIKGD